MSKRYYWLKIGEHFLDEDKMIFLEALPNGEKYIILWLKILLKCLKDKDNGQYGFLRFSDKIPYSPELMAQVFRMDIDVIRVGMKYFKELGMCDVMEDGTIYIEEVQKMIGRETDSAERMRRHRERKKLIESSCNHVTGGDATSDSNKEEDIDKEIEEEHHLSLISSRFLFKSIMKNSKPTRFVNNPPDIRKWAEDIEKLNRIDGVSYSKINGMIMWCTSHDFWQGNILSGNKLRKNYSQMEIQKKRNKSTRESPEERLRREGMVK